MTGITVLGPEDFGALPDDGIDDTDAFVRLFSEGGQIEIPEGVWDFAQDFGVDIDLRRAIDVTAHGAVFKSHGVAGNLFDVRPDPEAGGGMSIVWAGGTFDMRDHLNSTVIAYEQVWPPVNVGPSSMGNAFSVFGSIPNKREPNVQIETVDMTGVTVVASDDDFRTAGGDSGVSISTVFRASVTDSLFVGTRDSSIYFTADGGAYGVGGNYVATRNIVVGSYGGVVSHRGADDVTIADNIFIDVPRPTQVRSTVDLTANRIRIIDNFMEDFWIGVSLEDTRQTLIDGNHMFGRMVDIDYPGDNIVFLDIAGSDRVFVRDNLIVSGLDWSNNAPQEDPVETGYAVATSRPLDNTFSDCSAPEGTTFYGENIRMHDPREAVPCCDDDIDEPACACALLHRNDGEQLEVALLYEAVLDRDGEIDPAGHAYWTGLLEGRRIALPTLFNVFLFSDESRAKNDLADVAGSVIDNLAEGRTHMEAALRMRAEVPTDHRAVLEDVVLSDLAIAALHNAPTDDWLDLLA